jgi:hypothetical protein
MRAVAKEPASTQVALATLLPLTAGAFAAWAMWVVGDRLGIDMVPYFLLGSCTTLFVSANWLNRVLFQGVRALIPYAAAIVTSLLIWSWQWQAFNSLVPGSGLTYGYFLRPDGAKAGFWVLTCPFWTGLTCLSVCFIAALTLGWRAGARRSLACILPWWLLALIVFAAPSMYLAAKGNAAVFI